MNIKAELDVKDAIASLEGLKEAIQRKIMRQALEFAATPMLAAARRALRRGHGYETGLLKESLGRKTATYPSKNLVIVVIGPQRNFARQVTIAANRIFRQVGGTRGKYGRGTYSSGKLVSPGRVIVAGVFGRMRRITRFSEKWPLSKLANIKRDPNKISHLVERGFNRGNKRNQAFAFMQPAYASTKATCEQRFAERVARGIAAEAARLYTRKR